MQLSSSLTRSRDLSPQSRDQLYPISVGTAGHVTGQEGHVTSLTSWRDACDISARSFGLPTIYERPIVQFTVYGHILQINVPTRIQAARVELKQRSERYHQDATEDN